MKQICLLSILITFFASCKDGTVFSGDSGNMDWTFFRGNASLSGYTDVRLPGKPTLLWTFKSDSRTVSSPVIKGGVTYWCDRKGMIRGVNIEGRQVFEYALNTAVESTPLIYDSTLYIGRIDGFMTAISLTTGDTVWNYETLGQISASPNMAEFGGKKTLVFGSYDNYLYCIDVSTGKEVNKFESGYYLNGAAALRKNYVIFGGCDSWVRIINCQTGIQTDSLLVDSYIPASPAIMGDYCYIGDCSGNIYKLMLEDGKIARHKKIVETGNENGSFVSVPAASSDLYCYLSGERLIKAVSCKNCKQLWQYMLKGNTGESSPVISNDKIIICTKTGIVSILDAGTGELLWDYDTGEQIVGSPAVINNHFFILTAKGTLFCFGNNK
jgi:outer membrane protein assembly factor BamB